MKYCDLPRNAQLCLTIYECCGPGKYIPVGGTSLPLFGKLGVYKQVSLVLLIGYILVINLTKVLDRRLNSRMKWK